MESLHKILIAEDNDNDIELTLEALREYNLINDIDIVKDGAEALDYIYKKGKYASRTTNSPAVILLDIKMPKVDGIEVLRRVKADEAMKHIPIVMVTSSREERDIIDSYNLGTNAYIVKPVDFHQFVDAVKTLGRFWAVYNETPVNHIK